MIDSKREANLAAKKMLKGMGEGWKPRTWDNLGWHFQIIKGKLSIDKTSNNSFRCWFDSGWSHNGVIVQFRGSGPTPKKAYNQLKFIMENYISRIKKELRNL